MTTTPQKYGTLTEHKLEKLKEILSRQEAGESIISSCTAVGVKMPTFNYWKAAAIQNNQLGGSHEITPKINLRNLSDVEFNTVAKKRKYTAELTVTENRVILLITDTSNLGAVLRGLQ
jgi:hypothetical protein